MSRIKEIDKKRLNFYILYTIIFIVCCIGVFYRYFSANKTFIYTGDNGDGWTQHYKAYIYYSNYLKEIFNNIFVNHKFVIPQWDFCIGEGADIIGTFNYYVIGDPIAFLSVFFSEENVYLLYDFGVLLRLYLSGLFFSWLCFYTKINNKYSILGGAITYVFCYWALISSVRHIYFLNPLMYLPLVILGVEKIINKDSPYVLTIAVLFSALSNFYYFYNIVLLTIVYVAIRLIILYKHDIKQLLQVLLRIFKYSLIGALMSMIVLLPTIISFLRDSRTSIDFGRHFVYPLSYYLDLPSSFLSTTRNYWLCMGFASPTLASLIVTIINPKKNKYLFVFVVLSLLFIIFPVFGQIFNGFSYISNKWCFAFSLLVSYNLAFQWENTSKYKILLIIVFVLLEAVFIVLGSNTNINVPMVILIAYVLLDFVLKKENIKQIIMIGLIAICAIFNANNFYKNYSKTATTVEESKNIFNISEAKVIKENIIDEDFYRYSGSNLTQNASVIFNTNSTDFYWSLNNPSISNYRNDLELSEYSLYKYKEYDKRFILYELANVKYYVTDKGYTGLLPNNFKYLKTIEDYDIYTNTLFIPFGYTYEKAMSYDNWKQMSSLEKEEALSKYIVLENCETNNNDYSFSSKKVDYELLNDEKIEINNNVIHVSNEDSSISLKFDINEKSNVYISIKGLKYIDENNWIKSKNDSSAISFFIDNNAIASLPVYTNDSRYYNGRTDFTFNLGSIEKGTSSIDIYLNKKGLYNFEEISINAIPFGTIENNVSLLGNETMKNVSFDTNKVSGTIDLTKDKYLLLSIPYSKGWKAYVDGKQIETYKANDAYMALYLTKGNHNIELKYSTPLLIEGLLLSMLGCVVLIVDIIISRKKKYERQ